MTHRLQVVRVPGPRHGVWVELYSHPESAQRSARQGTSTPRAVTDSPTGVGPPSHLRSRPNPTNTTVGLEDLNVWRLGEHDITPLCSALYNVGSSAVIHRKREPLGSRSLQANRLMFAGPFLNRFWTNPKMLP